MREIKFRVWDTYNNKMIPEKGGFYIGSINAEPMGGDDYLLMQYTGLKDRNGKEIFEGDIIKFWPFSLDFKGEGILVKVIFMASAFRFEYGGNAILAHSGCEIAGNIYENPELLKEKE